jgi:hypothetical protein
VKRREKNLQATQPAHIVTLGFELITTILSAFYTNEALVQSKTSRSATTLVQPLQNAGPMSAGSHNQATDRAPLDQEP